MRMRAQHRGNFAVEIPAQCFLFRCCFRVDIDDNNIGFRFQAGDFFFGRNKRAVNRRHENASGQIQNADIVTAGRRHQHGTFSGDD